MRGSTLFIIGGSGELVQQAREYVIGEMIHELGHGVYSLAAGRAAWDHDALTALGHARRVLHERIKSVSANLSLQCS